MSSADTKLVSLKGSWGVRLYVRGGETLDYYVEEKSKGAKAWMNLCEGYIKRLAKLVVDGYWIDAFASYPGNDKTEFVPQELVLLVKNKFCI